MTDVEAIVQRYYGDRPVLQRIEDALRAAGVDPEKPSHRELWPFDQLHSRGIAATREHAERARVQPSPSLAVSSYSASSQITYCRHGVGCGDWRTLAFVLVPSTKRMAAAGSRLDNLRPQGVSSGHSTSISRKCDSPSASANKLRIRIVYSPRLWRGPSIG